MERKSGPAILLIDGEHYPPVIRRAIDDLLAQGVELVAALLVGGKEKLGQAEFEFGMPVEDATEGREKALIDAIDRFKARHVIDISDEPVLGYVERCRLASIAAWKGLNYSGADFEFTAPSRPKLARVPSLSVIGTGKRTGKTAIAGATARALIGSGQRPVVVAMGRGGPQHPEVIDEPETLTASSLLRWVEQGKHAASDYIEDAFTAGVPSVGAWRAGGGMAGATEFTNYPQAVEAAHGLNPSMLLLEGSGAAIPPCLWDAGILVAPATIDPGHLCGYFGLYRLLLADLVVLTMVEESLDREHLAAVEKCIRNRPLLPLRVIHTVFRPRPLGDVSGKKVWFVTTAPNQAGEVLKQHLEENAGAKVLGMSHSLADRQTLRSELAGIQGVDALLVELKAAAADVVTRWGMDKGLEIVYVDNQPEMVNDPGETFDQLVIELADQAQSRFSSQ